MASWLSIISVFSLFAGLISVIVGILIYLSYVPSQTNQPLSIAGSIAVTIGILLMLIAIILLIAGQEQTALKQLY